jgi:hypothetical protein
MSNQFDITNEAILSSVVAGTSIDEAARNADVPVATVRRWLRDGRRGKSPYDTFAEALDNARADRQNAEDDLDGPLDPREAELLLAKAARKGSVPALRLWFELKNAGESSKRGAGARELLAKVFDD